MKCSRCHKEFELEAPRCPHCGETNPAVSGVFQTSAVLISAPGAERVYRSVDDVPPRLRTKLRKSTNSANSATILIADRRGRREIERAFRDLPEGAHRRLLRAIAGVDGEAGPEWLTPARKKLILAVLILLALTMVAAVFAVRWA